MLFVLIWETLITRAMNKQTHIIKYLAITAMLITAQSCYIDFDDDGFGCESGNGSLVTESRNVFSFNSITNIIGADVVIRQQIDREFRITAPDNLINDITTRVVDGNLIIDYHGCFRNADIDIYIANPEVDGVHNVGSGTIIGDNVWSSDRLELSISGSGRIDAEFFANQLNAAIVGSGVMDLFGEADRSFLRVSGSGDFFAFDLECNDQDIVISGFW